MSASILTLAIQSPAPALFVEPSECLCTGVTLGAIGAELTLEALALDNAFKDAGHARRHLFYIEEDGTTLLYTSASPDPGTVSMYARVEEFRLGASKRSYEKNLHVLLENAVDTYLHSTGDWAAEAYRKAKRDVFRPVSGVGSILSGMPDLLETIVSSMKSATERIDTQEALDKSVTATRNTVEQMGGDMTVFEERASKLTLESVKGRTPLDLHMELVNGILSDLP